MARLCEPDRSRLVPSYSRLIRETDSSKNGNKRKNRNDALPYGFIRLSVLRLNHVSLRHGLLPLTIVSIAVPLFVLLALKFFKTRHVLLRRVRSRGFPCFLSLTLLFYTILLLFCSLDRIGQLVRLALVWKLALLLFRIKLKVALTIVRNIRRGNGLVGRAFV
ncbi:hypothetical protein C8J33_11938 [Rhizobium sp. PP-CC-3G-465]|nr:hypothetical protein C8J33_11938 [Rhizobium sp. PP-CC-3G-465]